MTKTLKKKAKRAPKLVIAPPKRTTPRIRAAKQSTLERQQRELCKLYLIWNTCTETTAARYIHDTLGVSMTRACSQRAREITGVAAPKYAEKTRRKKFFVEAYLWQLFAQGMIFDVRARKELYKQLEDRFGETTNHTLLKHWIGQVMSRMPTEHEQVKYHATRAMTELQDLGLMDPIKRDKDLL